MFRDPLPSIDFTGDWKEITHGQLGVGRDFRINYDGSRLPGRPTMYGKPAWKIYVEYKFNNGKDFKSEDLGSGENNMFTKVISIPIEAEVVVMWFKHWSYYGGYNYDSDYGKNYHFPITRPSIVFTEDWKEDVHGELEAGEDFDLFYNSKRLKEGAEITAQMKFVGDEVVDKKLHAKENSFYQTAIISIPDDAEKLVMWFYRKGVDGNKHYDSDFGKNYHFRLSE